MSNSPWERVGAFFSRAEFDRFLAWMTQQVAERVAEDVPVAQPYLGATSFSEKWYRHIDSEEIWRLVWPDGPFPGSFERVS